MSETTRPLTLPRLRRDVARMAVVVAAVFGGISGFAALLNSKALGVQSKVDAGASHQTRYIDARWYHDGTFIDGDFCVVGGLFAELSNCSDTAKIVDLMGLYIVPPYGDAHTHNFMLAPAKTHDSIMEGMRAQGVYYAMEQDSFDPLPTATRARIGEKATPDVIATHAIVGGAGTAAILFKDQLARQRAEATSASDLSFQGDGNLFYQVDSAADLVNVAPELVNRGDQDFVKAMLSYSEKHDTRAGQKRFDAQVGLNPALLAPLVDIAHAAEKRVSVHIESAADFAVAARAKADFIAHLPGSWKLAPGPGFFGTGYADIDRSHWLISRDDVRFAKENGTCTITTTMKDKTHIDYMRASDIARENLKMLFDEGACVIVGADAGQNVIDELQQVSEFGGLDNATAIDLLVRATPEAIFPGRAIGHLMSGYEASFVALGGNPLEDLAALKDIRGIVKQGHVIRLPEAPATEEAAENETSTGGLAYQAAPVAPGIWSLSVAGAPYADTIGVIDVGDSFVLIDDGFPDGEESVRDTLRGFGDKPISHVINTHFHHVGANAVFGGEATIIAHKSVRDRMSREVMMYGRVPLGPFPENAMPDVEVDGDETFRFGEWSIELRHYPSAHTDGDLIIFVNHPDLPDPVIFSGDFVVNGLAVPDAENGGSTEGHLAGLEQLQTLVPENAIVVTGHGGLLRGMDIAEHFRAYRDMYHHFERQLAMGTDVGTVRAMPLPDSVKRWLGQPGALPRDFVIDSLMMTY